MMWERTPPGPSYVCVTQVRRTRQVDKRTAIRESADGHFISERRVVHASVLHPLALMLHTSIHQYRNVFIENIKGEGGEVLIFL